MGASSRWANGGTEWVSRLFKLSPLISKIQDFSSSHVLMCKLDHKEGWAPNNWCLWTVVPEKTLKSPLDCQEINQSILKEINPLNIHWKDWCWSSDTLATWFEEPTHWKRPWCWERLRAGGEGVTQLDGIINTLDISMSKLWEIVKDTEAWHAAVHGVAKNQTWLSN